MLLARHSEEINGNTIPAGNARRAASQSGDAQKDDQLDHRYRIFPQNPHQEQEIVAENYRKQKKKTPALIERKKKKARQHQQQKNGETDHDGGTG